MLRPKKLKYVFIRGTGLQTVELNKGAIGVSIKEDASLMNTDAQTSSQWFNHGCLWRTKQEKNHSSFRLGNILNLPMANPPLVSNMHRIQTVTESELRTLEQP